MFNRIPIHDDDTEPFVPIIDDGDYADPHRSTTPDFIQQDDDGWIRLKPATAPAPASPASKPGSSPASPTPSRR
jgi:hypothetical protein